ncbi:MAG: prolyl-tRNA synthetase associated domain-containing protein [Clostridia bacterium]|nr:prolyl-tRNA synthetase associated domain-containing protein [Clostridia bacterium]
MDNIEKSIAFLDSIGVEYEIFRHEAAASIEQCEEIEKIISGKICKNLLLRTTSGDKVFLLMTDGRKRFVTKEVSKKLGSSRLSFADGEMMETLLNTKPGSLSIMSLMFDKDKKVFLAADRDVFREEFICCHPCDNTATLKIRTEDVIEKIIPALGREIIIVE